MERCLESKTNDCKNCYKCIRHCPTKAISFKDGKAKIVHDDCILCGACYLVCPQGVKVVRNDINRVKSLIANNERVIVSMAPSFISNYGDYSIESIKQACKKLGFYDMEETAIGATIVKKAYDQILEQGDRDVVISTCCHSINLLVQRHFPKAIDSLANVLSPMLAHGKDIKARYGADTKVVFIGPCIAKKDEAERHPEYIDAVLTFKEFNEWLETEKIELIKSTEVEKKEESKARLFPTCGGVLATMDRKNRDYVYVCIDGVENSMRVIQDIVDGKIHNAFIEMSACTGSCVNGPLTDKSRSFVSSYLEIRKQAGTKDFTEGILAKPDIMNAYNKLSVIKAEPSEQLIEETLVKMHKPTVESRLNCGSCGYQTCREKAIAIIQGKANIEMCLPYLMHKAQSFTDQIVFNSPNGIMVLDENLDIQLVNQAMCSIVGVPNKKVLLNQNITTVMDPEDFARALGGENTFQKKKYLMEYDKYVESTSVYDEEFHIIVVIMRDITTIETQTQKRAEALKKTVDITDEVIKKNMRAVQEIASLLGESAAETKVALSSLKETLKND